MSIIAVESEKNLESLIKQHYGELSSAQLSAVKKSVLAANAHLSAKGELKRGMVVNLPALAIARDETPSSSARGLDIERALPAALATYRREIARQTEQAKAELDGAKQVLKDQNFQRAIAVVKEAAPIMEAFVASAKTEAVELDAARKFLDGASFEQLSADLKAVLQELP